MPVVYQNSNLFTNIQPNGLFVKYAIRIKNVHKSDFIYKFLNPEFIFHFNKTDSMHLKDRYSIRNMLFFVSIYRLKSLNPPLIIELKDI